MSYCEWFTSGTLQRKYHEEWGTPLHDDKMQFEYLSMEVMQCGLSFSLILKKRSILRACFDNFDFERIAKYDENDVERILNTEGMIHSPQKIRAIINNANAFCKIREEKGSFSSFIWSFTGNKSVLYKGHEKGLIPSSNGLSKKISDELKKRGFKYTGPVVMYSHLQACGIINDHDENCKRRQYLIEHYPTVVKHRYAEKGVGQF